MKKLTSQKRCALQTARKLLQEKAIAIANDIRGLLRNFELKVGLVGTADLEDRVRELTEDIPDLAEIMAALLTTRQKLREEFSRLHRKVSEIAKGTAICRRLMTVPGVGPVTSLAL
ncbi:hypothetical protein G6M08_31440 [Agrobacterium rhizogenes]|nr:hypothetical protein [Rhizobium rhizogenes]